MRFTERIGRHVSNIPGWRSRRRFLIIESDDWGSIRMPSIAAFQRLEASGVPLKFGNSSLYNQLDSLACPEDFSALFDTLSSYKDINGRNPVFTAMSLVANPDFQKIEESGFQHYFFEPFTKTLERYGLEDSLLWWKQGIASGLFIPQFHGREHLNVAAWLRALQRNDGPTLAGFKEGFWGFRNRSSSVVNFQAAFDLEKPEDLDFQKGIIESGLNLFEALHGYKATFFVPPNGPFNNALCSVAAAGGIKYISTPKWHIEPQGNQVAKKKYFYLGKKNDFGQVYLVRNCFFEPYQTKLDWVNSCLNEIDIAFTWGKPAIISSHRVNYIGRLNAENRSNGLKRLKELLKSVLRKWPNVEFITSHELGKIISETS